MIRTMNSLDKKGTRVSIENKITNCSPLPRLHTITVGVAPSRCAALTPLPPCDSFKVAWRRSQGVRRRSAKPLSPVRIRSAPPRLMLQARSSVGERYIDTVEVGSSILPAPTKDASGRWGEGC